MQLRDSICIHGRIYMISYHTGIYKILIRHGHGVDLFNDEVPFGVEWMGLSHRYGLMQRGVGSNIFP